VGPAPPGPGPPQSALAVTDTQRFDLPLDSGALGVVKTLEDAGPCHSD
jgi:hypothetical protein